MATATTEAEIWERVIHPTGELRRRDVARSILQLSFTLEERARMHELASGQEPAGSAYTRGGIGTRPLQPRRQLALRHEIEGS